MNESYLETVRLLLAVAPSVFRGGGLALKGGTAINLFLKDVPRLSVDLDLVFTDHTRDREGALRSISELLADAEDELSRLGYTCEAGASALGDEVKLFISRGNTRVKVEVNSVFRGTLRPVAEQPPTDRMHSKDSVLHKPEPADQARSVLGSPAILLLRHVKLRRRHREAELPCKELRQSPEETESLTL